MSRNPLTNALDEKRRQLSRSRFPGLRGIIICDGDCEALKERSRVNAAYGCQEIIGEFLRKHSSIQFVLILRIEERTRPLWPTVIRLLPKLFFNQVVAKSSRSEIGIVVERLLERLPPPEDTPQNALFWLTGVNKNVGRSLGGFSMNDRTIKLSARAVTELLAGRIDQKRFLQEQGLMEVN